MTTPRRRNRGDDDGHHHGVDVSEVGPEDASSGWHTDNVELTTVGVDIGSSTSHLMFSRLHLQRMSQSLSSRFAVVGREVLHRSPIMLTPYKADGLIDVDALEPFVERAYREAAVSREDVDTGTVILTGTALERSNARAVAELFAEEGGKFVCASAGHRLEALLSAHGSGAVARSLRSDEVVLNVDVGGGTSKLSLVDRGEIIATTALSVGARLVAFDSAGRVARVEGAAARLGKRLGIDVVIGGPLETEARRRLADAMADALIEAINATPSPSETTSTLLLLDPLPAEPKPDVVTFSGGTSEYFYGDSDNSGYGDLAGELAAGLVARRDELPGQLVDSRERIRATVVGASQFTVQLSGNTIYVSDEAVLPLRNVPVALARLEDWDVVEAEQVAAGVAEALRRLDLDRFDGPVAMALPWSGEPAYATMRALAEGVLIAHRRRGVNAPIMIALDADVGVTVGRILDKELDAGTTVVSVDGLELAELDFVDVGEVIRPANVVPVVVKSLIFPASAVESPG